MASWLEMDKRLMKGYTKADADGNPLRDAEGNEVRVAGIEDVVDA